jgi:hypothetical protein
MTPELVAWLQSAEAHALLATIDPSQHLQSMSQLRRHVASAQAAALFELATVRQLATRKFPDGAQLWFTREALEQASHSRVAQHRAAQFAGRHHIADLCCGCGGDLLALAPLAPCIAVDSDSTRLALAHANITQRGLSDRVSWAEADVTTYALPDSVDAVFFDPGRRSGGRRMFHHSDYQPPLTSATAWRRAERIIAIKCAPGLDYHDLPLTPPFAIECVSLAGELRETVVWLDSQSPWQRRASVLGDTTLAQLDNTAPAHAVTCSAPQAFFYEPDVAVIRAGLVQHLAQQIGAQMIDRQIAYLTSADYHATPFARCWQVIDTLPFNERILKQTLRRLNAGAITVKKRGSPVDTDALAKRLSQPSGEALVVVLTQVADHHTAIICRGPYHPPEEFLS